MKIGARNSIPAIVTSIELGDVMALVKFDVGANVKMASVLTHESVDEMGLNVGDEVRLVVKAINVIPVKED